MERLWETWQGRRLAGLRTLEAANRFLTEGWVPVHNRTWTVPADGDGTAFVPYPGGQLARICALQQERVVGQEHCVAFARRRPQIPQAAWRSRVARCRGEVYEHLDGTLSLGHGPHTLGHYAAEGRLLAAPSRPVGVAA